MSLEVGQTLFPSIDLLLDFGQDFSPIFSGFFSTNLIQQFSVSIGST